VEKSNLAARIIDGKAIAREIQTEIKDRVQDFRHRTNITPKLAAVLVGEDAASQVYVRNKQRGCKRVGIESELHRLPVDTTSEQLLKLIHRLNHDSTVHGILVQLPLPPGIDEKSILDSIDPRKDVDAFHPHNVGLLSQGRPRFLPCTPHGIVQLLDRSNVEVAGKNVVVIGRSDIVGKPIAMMLQQKKLPGLQAANATVTVCHSRTQNLAEITRTADILIAAIGKPDFVSADMVKPGATVIDVGINRVQDRLVGDVDFDAVCQIAGMITPVPGGVGPLTVTMLLENTLSAAKIQSAD
jgi:methylenetetrahydrofolate dehydrogenase (NADP+)/methenyltetrahydrofolate cyclohydrolase